MSSGIDKTQNTNFNSDHNNSNSSINGLTDQVSEEQNYESFHQDEEMSNEESIQEANSTALRKEEVKVDAALKKSSIQNKMHDQVSGGRGNKLFYQDKETSIVKPKSTAPSEAKIKTDQTLKRKSIFQNRIDRLKAEIENNAEESSIKRFSSEKQGNKKENTICEALLRSSPIKDTKRIEVLQENKTLMNTTTPRFLLVKPIDADTAGTSEPPIKLRVLTATRLELLKKKLAEQIKEKGAEGPIDSCNASEEESE